MREAEEAAAAHDAAVQEAKNDVLWAEGRDRRKEHWHAAALEALSPALAAQMSMKAVSQGAHNGGTELCGRWVGEAVGEQRCSGGEELGNTREVMSGSAAFPTASPTAAAAAAAAATAAAAVDAADATSATTNSSRTSGNPHIHRHTRNLRRCRCQESQEGTHSALWNILLCRAAGAALLHCSFKR